MFHKKFVSIIFIISLVIVGGASLLIFSIDCWGSTSAFENFLCNGFFEQKIEPLLWSFLPLLAISFILLFVRRETFIAWAKFAAPAFAVMLAVIFYTYNNKSQMGGWVNWGSDEEFATVLLPPLFFLISLAIIIYKQRKLRKGGTQFLQTKR